MMFTCTVTVGGFLVEPLLPSPLGDLTSLVLLEFLAPQAMLPRPGAPTLEAPSQDSTRMVGRRLLRQRSLQGAPPLDQRGFCWFDAFVRHLDTTRALGCASRWTALRRTWSSALGHGRRSTPVFVSHDVCPRKHCRFVYGIVSLWTLCESALACRTVSPLSPAACA